MKKTVVLFGATGGIGAYTALELIEQGYRVIAVGKRKSDNGFFSENGCDFYLPVDITKRKDFLQLPTQGVFAVINFAGMLPARMVNYDPKEYIDTQLTGALNILDYSVSVGAEKYIYAHSWSDVIHLSGTIDLIPADFTGKFPLNNDHSVYAICKNAAVNLAEHYYHKYKIKRYLLRLPNIYLYHPDPFYWVDGERVWQRYRLLIEKAKRGEKIAIWGNPSLVRDIIYVKDLVRIVICSLKINMDGGIYNAGTGIGVSLDDQIKGIVDVFAKDKRSEIEYWPSFPDSSQYIMDISKTTKELGFMPVYNYISYLKDMKQEMKNNRFEKLWGRG